MKEIRIHGRGGQGSVTAAELLAVAAFDDGKYSQAFPAFGVERRGAPVMAFVRLDDKPIRLRSQIYEPDYVIVQDATLVDVVNIAAGTKPDGIILINTEKSPSSFNLNTKARVKTLDATKIAIDVIGKPIVNTTLVGAFAGISGLIKPESIIDAVMERFPGKVGEKNAAAIRVAYDLMEAQR
ncbi:MAG: pyruvate ferredoxin oxidoreductase subunit gamma [Candidatus Methanoperedens sp.]|nr:pyruvate ferredoxin oxidoreductase subunit gamma [Candidatus Methanoperedens sp.]MCE8425441.1 pyruvate ferredoxin oxidoreductase subunit gamma [Candidatus Methanoperedens sp.]MCE8427357.1 pyruvate ferredoxin oxidoreductase subunit gamma [Candidatus Methanoperedens sp.]